MAKVGDEVIIRLQTQSYSDHLKLLSFDINIHNTICKLIYECSPGLFVTDKFYPDHINENNDYWHYGFLKLLDCDFFVLKIR